MRSKASSDEIDYKKYRNTLNSLLRNAERQHYDSSLNENISNLKNTWRIIKEIINKKKSNCINFRFFVNNSITSNKQEIADGFNAFFVNVGPNLANKIPDDGRSATSLMPNKNIHNMYIETTDASEVFTIIKNLKIGSAGYDSISAKVAKSSYASFITPLLHVINLSLTQGVFPRELKLARVIPIYKSGDPMCLSNYRPVSVLPLFSKIFERLMYNRLLSFLTKHKILYDFQFGFRPGHSPNMALIYLVDKISNALENGEFALGLFLDFSKAFDTVNHDVLLEKMDFYGIRGLPQKWFKSYLSEREQLVDYDGCKSRKMKIRCRVPQGSILGPLLFLLYINDLANVSDKLFSILFADDSNIFLTGNNLDELINTMNSEITKIVDWLNLNKLSLNIDKTHFIIFPTSRSKSKTTNELCINNVKIKRVNDTKFLGVYIDSKLSWDRHIQHVKSKVSRGLGILCKARKYFLQGTLLTLYYSLIYPHFIYCIEVWGHAGKSYLNPVNKLLKRAARIISGSSRLSSTVPLLSNLRLLDLSGMFIYFVQLFMYKYHHGELPYIFNGFFVLNRDVHMYNTRNRDNFRTSFARSTVKSRTLRVVGVRYSNYFSSIIDYNCSVFTYKYALKCHIISIDTTTLY